MLQNKTGIFSYLLSAILIIGMASCSKTVVYSAPVSLSQAYISNLSAEKQLAYRFVTTSKANLNRLDSLFSDGFISSDRYWAGDKETFIQRKNTDKIFSQIEPIRILQDDSLVAIQSRMIGDTLKFRWDILRIEHQKIQEHWSNVQDSIGVNPDNHSEIDGPTIADQLEKIATNRALISRFIDQCMIREDGGALKFFNFGLYIQHNRDVGDGVNGLLWGMLK
jgi:predicted SnoaL-like aldol condensation-catalyzing enzyme